MKEIYQVLAGAMGRERNLDQIANNLANVNTTGFKKDGAAFVDFFRQQLQTAQAASGATGALPQASVSSSIWPHLAQGYTDMSMGPQTVTEQPLDLSLAGEGFFRVEVPGEAGPFYTRSGNFTLNAAGELTTSDGRRVLSDGGSAIRFERNGAAISITQQGEVYEGDAQVGKLGIYEFEDPGLLRKQGATMFTAAAGVTAQAATATTVRQGALEGSNVNAIEELVAMIRTQRAYQVDQKVVQTIDELTSKRIDATMNR